MSGLICPSIQVKLRSSMRRRDRVLQQHSQTSQSRGLPDLPWRPRVSPYSRGAVLQAGRSHRDFDLDRLISSEGCLMRKRLTAVQSV